MIEYLSGVLRGRLASGVIVDVSGVGYGLDLPIHTLCELPADGSHAEFWVYTRVREDALKLYGFKTRDERKTFEVLLQISGVGPKVAMALLSTISVARLRAIVEQGEVSEFEAVPGIGKRTAEKILVELKGKVDRLPVGRGHHSPDGLFARVKGTSSETEGPDSELDDDLLSALMNLGYKDKETRTAIAAAKDGAESMDFSGVLKRALQALRNGSGGASASAGQTSGTRGTATRDQDLF
jgi:Holliday junction DNA helicase RuvA